jgi:exodeoxyribonuclease V beta subunit
MSESFHLLDTPLETGVTLLEASAGTGKTYALAALVLRLIAEEGVPIGRIVVTTYTIPATAELRERIRARLGEALDGFDEKPKSNSTPFVAEFVARHRGNPLTRSRIANALRDFDQASISTIHGFCHRMIQERTFESGTKPALELMPDESALVRETSEDFWRRNFGEETPGLTPIAMLSGFTPESLAKLFSSVSNHSQAKILPCASTWRKAAADVLAMLADFRAQWPGWRDAIERSFVSDPAWAIGKWKKREIIAPQFDLVERLAADANAPLSTYAALEYFRPSAIAKAKGISKKHTMPEHEFTTWCEAFNDACSAYSASLKSAFLAWAKGDLAERKERLGVIAFGDLLGIFHQALFRPGGERLAEAIRARFDVALVDEFQDTDPVQAAIFTRLFAAKPHRLFYIGDPKQAIYGFRGADLYTYLRVTETADRKFRLDTNHRSDGVLVAAVNSLFARPSAPFIDTRIPFEPVLSAKALDVRPLVNSEGIRAPMRFWFWDSEKPITTSSATELLPDIVASEIVRMLQSSRLGDRGLLPRDCAILCVKNAQCQEMQEALGKRGVPSVVLSNSSVFASDEARELYLVMSALASPSRESSIRAALATRLMGYDAAMLERVSAGGVEWEGILSRFQEYHTRWRDHGFIQTLRGLVQTERLRPRILAQPEGERRLTNLLHLGELLHATAGEFRLGPAGLLRWFADEMADPGSGDERELRLERDDDAVKILTIHKSKGLEWPVVFCPFLWAKADLRQNQAPLFHDSGDSAVLDLGSGDVSLARARAEHEQLSERMRLLYVALTRARHECHVVWGQFKDSENSPLMWLLEPPSSAGEDAPAALRAHAESLTSQMLRATLERLAAQWPAQLAITALPEKSATFFQPETGDSPVRGACVFQGVIDRSWRVSSFTAFTVLRDTEEGDYDRDVRPVFSGERRGIHAFPGGKKAGVCIHDIMEDFDFTRPSELPSLVEGKLRLHGMHSTEHALALVQTLRKLIETPLQPAAVPEKRAGKRREDVLELPLGDESASLRLSLIPKSRTLRELEFHLPTALIHPGELSQFTSAGLLFEPRRGILKGFIDLIFEHEGRFHIVDWKSNLLGSGSDAYTQEAMRAEIAHHRYDLQWQIYLVALHRYLRLRLGDAYDPAKNLGTVFYIFLRGVEPYQPSLGIHRAIPDLNALAALDQLFYGQ